MYLSIYIYSHTLLQSQRFRTNHPAKRRGFCSESLQINQAVLVFFCSHVTPQSWVNFTNCYMFNASSTSFCKLFEAILFFRTKHGHGDMVPGKKVVYQCTILTVHLFSVVIAIVWAEYGQNILAFFSGPHHSSRWTVAGREPFRQQILGRRNT